MNLNPKYTYDAVMKYYGKTLSTSKDLKTDACCTAKAPPADFKAAMKMIPNEVMEKYYGCGLAVPTGIDGLNILDLGSGSGRDCYIAAKLVGPNGSVTGIDMTDEQLAVANNNVARYTETLGYKKPNLRFLKGYIEFLREAGIADKSMDIVISNCVINLSPDKPRVLKAVYDVLKDGGEFYFSDVYADRRLPQAATEHAVLLGECLGGALYTNDFVRLCRATGFTDPRVVSKEDLAVNDQELRDAVGNARFYSITYRLFKIPDRLETLCEDYGQVAVYKGTMSGTGHKNGYVLDDHHYFPTNKPVLVCGNTASMLQETWLKSYFTITGDRSVHYGEFPCGAPAEVPPEAATGKKSGGGCC